MNEQMMHTQKNGNDDRELKTEDSKKALNYKPRDIRGPEQPRNRYRCKIRQTH